MDSDRFLISAKQEIERQLDKLIPDQSPLSAAARYSLLAPAKRLRPLLVLATVESYGLPQTHALIPACVLELIHTYSLIHDDLPCMDDDDLRRGRPSLHKVYPEWQALLTGDYLLTFAFEILADAPALTAEQKIALVRSLSHHAGAKGMIGGQMIDLQFEGQTIDWQTLEQMHRGKTAGLIIAALEFGGIIAKAPPSDIQALKNAALSIGIAFQIIDDILDTTSTEEELGKPIGSDHINAKATAVSILGVEEAQAKAEMLLNTAEKSLNALSKPAPLLHALFAQMVNRRR